MSESVLIENIVMNKHVQVDGTDYKLTIEKEKEWGTYKVYLSALDDQFTREFTFSSLNYLGDNLKNWIVSCHGKNTPESLLIRRLKEWDGVINT